MFRKSLGFILLAMCTLAVRPARADISYQYITDQTNYNAAAGASVTVNIYLQETLNNGSTSLIAADTGMFGAGVAVQQTKGPGSSAAAAISSISVNNSTIGAGGGFGSNGAVANNNPKSTAFDQTNTSSDGTNAGLIESIAIGTANGPTTDGSTSTSTGKILLGTLTVTAGASGTTTYSVTSFANSQNALATKFGEGNTITNGVGYDLDSTNNAFLGGGATYTGANDATTYTFTVATVPEPSSLLLGALGAAGLSIREWFRRRRQRMLKLA
jgi:hypothetical protein